MQTLFPEATGSSGQYITAFRHGAGPTSAEQVGVLVCKRHYNIVGNELIPSDDNKDIKLQDETEDVSFDSDTFTISLFEQELAAFKPSVDVVLLLEPTLGLTYRIKRQTETGVITTWLQRIAPNDRDNNIDADAAYHIFGWEPKYDSIRGDQAGFNAAPPKPAPEIPDLQNFNNLHFNAYRRSFALPNYAIGGLTQGDQIIFTELSDPNDNNTESENLRFTLPDPPPWALLYLYKGYGKDDENHWQVESIQDFRLDTLVIYENKEVANPSPDEKYKAFLIWRAVWPYQDYPVNNYRQVIVNQTLIQGGA